MEQTNQAYLGLRQALETAANAMDPEIRAHSLRTGQRMETILKEMDRQDLLDLWNWGDLSPLNYHDMGKIPGEYGTGHTEIGEIFLNACISFLTKKAARQPSLQASRQISAAIIMTIMANAD